MADIDITQILREMAAGKTNEIGDYWSPSWAVDGAAEIDRLRAELTEARRLLDEAANFWQMYSNTNEPGQDDIRDEKDEMLAKMRAAP